MPIDVTVITGFLGSGKTTFLNHLMNNLKGKRILIIENEFGDINIDKELVKKDKGTRVFDLSNGCICCSLNKELGAVLNSIILSGEQYDHMFIEATGIADPSDIVQMFTGGARVQRYFKLDSVVCLIDALNFLNNYKEYGEVGMQLKKADIALINKTDLVNNNTIKQIETELLLNNPTVISHHIIQGKIEPSKVLHLDIYSAKTMEDAVFNFNDITIDITPDNKHKYESYSLEIPGSFDMHQISSWLEDYLFAYAKTTLRIKGVLAINDMKHKLIVQSAGYSFEVFQGLEWQDNNQISKIVFLGTDIDKDYIEETMFTLSKKA